MCIKWNSSYQYSIEWVSFATHIIFTCQKRTLSLSSSLKKKHAGCSIGSKRNISKRFFWIFASCIIMMWSIFERKNHRVLLWPFRFQFGMVGNLTCQIWLWWMNGKGKCTLIETNGVSTADAIFWSIFRRVDITQKYLKSYY